MNLHVFLRRGDRNAGEVVPDFLLGRTSGKRDESSSDAQKSCERPSEWLPVSPCWKMRFPEACCFWFDCRGWRQSDFADHSFLWTSTAADAFQPKCGCCIVFSPASPNNIESVRHHLGDSLGAQISPSMHTKLSARWEAGTTFHQPQMLIDLEIQPAGRRPAERSTIRESIHRRRCIERPIVIRGRPGFVWVIKLHIPENR